MTPYEQGFAEGERAAFDDRANGRLARVMRREPMTPYGKGWWAGYVPRSLAWSLSRKPIQCRHEVEA